MKCGKGSVRLEKAPSSDSAQKSKRCRIFHKNIQLH